MKNTLCLAAMLGCISIASAASNIENTANPEIRKAVQEFKRSSAADKEAIRRQMMPIMTDSINNGDEAKRGLLKASYQDKVITVNLKLDSDTEKAMRENRENVFRIGKESLTNSVCPNENVKFVLALGIKVVYKFVGANRGEYGTVAFTNKECGVNLLN